jgi:hypothetical protein
MIASRKQVFVCNYIRTILLNFIMNNDITSLSNVSSLRDEIENDFRTRDLPDEIKDELESNLRNIWSLINRIKK